MKFFVALVIAVAVTFVSAAEQSHAQFYRGGSGFSVGFNRGFGGYGGGFNRGFSSFNRGFGGFGGGFGGYGGGFNRGFGVSSFRPVYSGFSRPVYNRSYYGGGRSFYGGGRSCGF